MKHTSKQAPAKSQGKSAKSIPVKPGYSTVSFYLPPDVAEYARKEAASLGISKDEYYSRLIDQDLKRDNNRQNT